VTPVIFVLAGVNGAGKSSLGGSFIRKRGLNYFNPDEAAAKIRQQPPNFYEINILVQTPRSPCT
jgi:predicted ABC-type ATPase